jgi:hypothetical protein
MFELKLTFESDIELLEFTRRLDREINFSIACSDFDNHLRSIVKYGQHDDLVKEIEKETHMHNVQLVDAVDYCRTLFSKALSDNGVSLYE